MGLQKVGYYLVIEHRQPSQNPKHDLFFCLFVLLYNIVVVLPHISMNPPWEYMCSPSWTPLPPSSPYHPSGSSQCTSPKDPVSNLDWWFISYMILYMFQCYFKSSHPCPLPQSPKDCSIHLPLLISCIQGYCYHLSKFHIYELVYRIGIFFLVYFTV